MRNYLIILFLCLGLCSCDPIVIEKVSPTLQRGLYAASDCLNAGDVYHAGLYLANIEKFVPIPALKDRIKINSLYVNGMGIVLVGDNLSGRQLVVMGSPDFYKLLKSGAINKQLQIDADKFSKEADLQKQKDNEAINAVVIENQKLKAAELKWHKSPFYQAYLVFETLTYIFPLSILAIIAVCFFCPPLVAPILECVGTLAHIAWSIFTGLIGWFLGLFVKKN